MKIIFLNILIYIKNEEFPDALTGRRVLMKKKERKARICGIFSADEETNKYEIEIKKMEQDRQDLVTAIIKLKESINELNQKGRKDF